MDTRTNRRRRILSILPPVLLAVALGAGGGQAPRSALESPRIAVVAPTPREHAITEWALERYRMAGLELPAVEIEFHPDPSGCRNNAGFYRASHLDLCVADAADAYARRVMVHELAHAWSVANLTEADRERFLGLRGLDAWNSWDEPWVRRGFEQAAEVITWGVDDDPVRILLPDREDTASMTTAYELLTGLEPLTLDPA